MVSKAKLMMTPKICNPGIRGEIWATRRRKGGLRQLPAKPDGPYTRAAIHTSSATQIHTHTHMLSDPFGHTNTKRHTIQRKCYTTH